ncbi:DUF1223 domain-containing protein [Ferrovibrio sp.]|jgi:hypothetical protein|uniref:DUF1223 domain-containing protein n=1 Tax=Ferrovibrio sp. TaxID=1917215 RepID=UPI0035B368CC
MRYWLSAMLVALLPLAAGQPARGQTAQGQTAPAQMAAQTQLVVLELFTSQGCNSCPPADALMTEWMKQPGVLPISLHVDYWDYLGWKDTLSRKGHNIRQQDYARGIGNRQVYTPQVVIDGQFQAVGSNREAIETALVKARKQQHVPLRTERGKTKGWQIVLPDMPNWQGEAKLLLCRYDRQHDVTIERGENHGRTLSYLNVARAWNEFGRWNGQTARYDVPDLDDTDWSRQGAVVMLQMLNAGANGPIIGAVDLKP